MKPIFNSKKPHFYQSTDHHLSLMHCTMTVFTFHSSLLQGRLRRILEIIVGWQNQALSTETKCNDEF